MSSWWGHGPRAYLRVHGRARASKVVPNPSPLSRGDSWTPPPPPHTHTHTFSRRGAWASTTPRRRAAPPHLLSLVAAPGHLLLRRHPTQVFVGPFARDDDERTPGCAMILDFIYLSSDDDEAIVTELNVHRKDHSVHVKAEIVDLTGDEDSFEGEGEHLAYGQFDAAQGTTCLKPELFADDGQAKAAWAMVMSKKQDLGAGDGQDDAAQCTGTLEMQDLGVGDGQSDALQPTATLQMQELRADGQGNAAHCTANLHIQGLRADDVQGDAAQRIATLQPQELRADDVPADASQCVTADDIQCDVAHCTSALQRQESDTAHGKGNAAQCTTTLHRQEFLEAGDSMQEAVQLRNSAEATMSVSSTQGTGRLTGFLNASHVSTAAPFPRQFWKAGGQHVLASQVSINNGQNCLRVHPKFLHSNATSHKWPFGAIAELLDNAIDEVNNGATFVKIDKMKHSPDGDYSLVIEDNGGGMSPKSLRHCLSFGFSQKCTTSSIGQYGNGFKTSTMRLGADAIVFTCTKDTRRLTRSVGLLSYTFLMRCNCNDTFVPVVDYEFDASSSNFKRIMDSGEKHFSSNLSILLRWSPFSTEDELLNQFSDMDCHGTKIIVFNLWLNDALEMELDFTTDKEDIIISGVPEIRGGRTMLERNHVANRFRYSLRVYASILYLHVPESFQIILCGRAVEPHYVVNDLIFPECIRYRPQVEATKEVEVITTIGYLKGAPRLDIYGFNIYHKNRLILPYWRAGSCDQNRRGIAGVLEANFIRPTHDKQDFERTGLFYRLETRLKDMANEYGRYHCHLVGYTPKRPPPAHYGSTTGENDDNSFAGEATTETCSLHRCSNGYDTRDPLQANAGASIDQMDCGACPSVSINVGTLHTLRNAPQQSQAELCKRRKFCPLSFWRAQKRRNTNAYSDQPESDNDNEMAEYRQMLDQNTMLKAECSELEAAGKEQTSKVCTLRKELDVWRQMYNHMRSSLEGLQRSQSNYSIGFL
ncbi:hypothetical protein U9M48_012604 [Paspalum notatum var. saurae]|uniref:Morc S5 domain-containing protein n=1 Tax=Paspalum notatum var. saurae TaxID=547442 RepID=A0AAQ3SXT6_PASNO